MHQRARSRYLLNKGSTGSARVIKSLTKRLISRSNHNREENKTCKVDFNIGSTLKFMAFSVHSMWGQTKLPCHALLTCHQPHWSLLLNCPPGHGIWEGDAPCYQVIKNPAYFRVLPLLSVCPLNRSVWFHNFKAIALADEISSGGPLGTYFLTSDMAHSGTGG